MNDKYGEQIRILGEGSFGVVYHFKKGSKEYAIKKNISSSYSWNESGLGSDILTEIAIQKKLTSDYIVRLLDVFNLDNDIYMVMPMASSSLSELINNKKILDENMKKYMYQLTLGALELYNNGIIHQDIKPDNILYFEDSDTLKIADFGAAKIDTCEKTIDPDTLYTLLWRPPEIILDMKYNSKADVWALGIVFMDMFSNKYLFSDITSEQELIDRIFTLFGTPKKYEWPSMYNSPASIKINEYEKQGLDGKINQDKYNKFRNLIYGMLTIIPENRLSIQQVCAHPYFDSIRSHDCNLLSCEQILQNNTFTIDNIDYREKILKGKQKLFMFLIEEIMDYTDTFREISLISKCLNIYQILFAITGKTGKDVYNIAVDISLKLTSRYERHTDVDWDLEWDLLNRINFNCLSNTLTDFVDIYSSYDTSILKLAKKFTILIDLVPLSFSNDFKKNALFSIFLACLYKHAIFQHDGYIPEFLKMCDQFIKDLGNFQDYIFYFLFKEKRRECLFKLDTHILTR